MSNFGPSSLRVAGYAHGLRIEMSISLQELVAYLPENSVGKINQQQIPISILIKELW